MRDSELAASIVDGDPQALAEAYDKYADLLWSYSRSLLSDADRAAEVVADTFVIAASRLDVLPVFGRLRAWLYAVARNECQRKLRSVKGGPAAYGADRLRRAAEVLSTGEQRQLRALLAAAFGGLDDAERDVMQMVWHGLDLAEVAAVLGVSRSDAYALFTRARDQLEASVGVLLIGWCGRGGCDAFEDMLYGKDSKLTPDLRARLSRHIAKCETCTERRRRQMRPSLMLCLSVGALLAEAADARAAASPAPVGLWEQVYQMTSQHSPDARWHKILGSRRVSFGPDGFPKQAAAAREGMGTPLKVAAVGVVAVAATATGWATHGHFTARPDAGMRSSSPSVTAVVPDANSAVTTSAHPSAPAHKATPGHSARHSKNTRPRTTLPSPTASPAAVSLGYPVSGSASASASGGSASVSTPASSGSGSVSTRSGSIGGSGSSSSGSGSTSTSTSTSTSRGSGSTPTSTSSSHPASTKPATGLVNGVVNTVNGVTSSLGL